MTKRVVVVDLEATCWRTDDDPALASNQRNETEVIEIGAVALGPNLEEADTFQTLVRPRRHPKLSAFCTELTGWTQADVDAAPWYPDAHAAFFAWAGGDSPDLIVASWGAWDGRQLRREALRWGQPAPRFSAFNLKRAFAQAHRARVGGSGWLGLGRAVEACGLSFLGQPHRALDDARNAARVLAQLPTDHTTGLWGTAGPPLTEISNGPV